MTATLPRMALEYGAAKELLRIRRTALAGSMGLDADEAVLLGSLLAKVPDTLSGDALRT